MVGLVEDLCGAVQQVYTLIHLLKFFGTIEVKNVTILHGTSIDIR